VLQDITGFFRQVVSFFDPLSSSSPTISHGVEDALGNNTSYSLYNNHSSRPRHRHKNANQHAAATAEAFCEARIEHALDTDGLVLYATSRIGALLDLYRHILSLSLIVCRALVLWLISLLSRMTRHLAPWYSASVHAHLHPLLLLVARIPYGGPVAVILLRKVVMPVLTYLADMQRGLDGAWRDLFVLCEALVEVLEHSRFLSEAVIGTT
jgi:hypothetical protein